MIPVQPEVPTQNLIWCVLAPRFQSALTVHKAGIWRLSGLRQEYGAEADGDSYRERELNALIAELTGLLLLAVIYDAANRRSMKNSGRGAGRPPDVVLPFLGPKLLSIFLRCNTSAGRQSAVTFVDGKLKQMETGRFLQFIKTVIEPLNQYFETELHRGKLSAPRMARFALQERRRFEKEMKQRQEKKTEVATRRQLLPLEKALREVFAIPE
jgi:hypothetical protein